MSEDESFVQSNKLSTSSGISETDNGYRVSVLPNEKIVNGTAKLNIDTSNLQPENNKYISIIDINSSPNYSSENGDTNRNDVSLIASSEYHSAENVSIIDVQSSSSLVSCNGCRGVSNGGSYETRDNNGQFSDSVNGELNLSNSVVDHSVSENGDLFDVKAMKDKLTRTRSGSSDYRTNEDTDDGCIVEFLDKSTDCAEARLAAKRQARAEAREIRMRELERQQRESEETSDKVFDIYSTPDPLNRSSRVVSSVASPRSSSVLSGGNNSYHSSRRSSEDSLDEATSLRDVRIELKEVEEKFRKAMIANAQLDNEKAAAAYQVELYKDRLEELDEQNSQLQREHKEKCRQFEALKRATAKLQEDLEITRAQLEERDRLIEEQGLVIVGGEYSSSDEENSDTEKRTRKPPKRALVSSQVATVLDQVGEGSLDVRLKKFVEHRNELLDELSRVKLELEEERARARSGGHRGMTLNGPSDDLEDIQREANKLLGDYKFKLQKAEQDMSTLQATVARLESQVVRYKSAAEAAEKVEDELKIEKRKLQRELRESQARVEELETAHSHLQRRLDKLKNAKSALLKDL